MGERICRDQLIFHLTAQPNSLTGMTQGTGIIVAPDLVVTCAHLFERQSPESPLHHFRCKAASLNNIQLNCLFMGTGQPFPSNKDVAILRASAPLLAASDCAPLFVTAVPERFRVRIQLQNLLLLITGGLFYQTRPFQSLYICTISTQGHGHYAGRIGLQRILW